MPRVFVLALIFLLINQENVSQAQSNGTRCSSSTGRRVSLDASLLPRTATTPGIIALHDIEARFSANPLRDIVSPGSKIWCTDYFLGNYVNMTFTQPVVLEGMLSSGGVSNFSGTIEHHFVNKFSLLFVANGKLVRHDRVFTASDSSSVYYSLKEPIVGQTFQFSINDVSAHMNVFCWKLALYGCTEMEAESYEVCPVHMDSSASKICTETTVSSTIPALSVTATASATAVSTVPDVITTYIPTTLSPYQTNCASFIGKQRIADGIIGFGAAILVIGLILILVAIAFICGVVVWNRKKRPEFGADKKQHPTLVNKDVEMYTLGSDEALYSRISNQGQSQASLYDLPFQV